jgi:hypothetical protein
VSPLRSVLSGAAAVISVLIAVPAAGQPPSAPTPTTTTPLTQTRPAEEMRPGSLPPSDLPGVLLPPPVGVDYVYAPPARGPLTLTPSFAITEEYNDNVFFNNANKKSDFITQFTPGLTLQIQHPGFRLLSAYNFTAEIYAKNTELSDAANRQNFLTSLTYEATPGVTLSLTEGFNYNRNSNAVTTSGISNGRQPTWGNVLSAALGVRLTPRTTWNLSGAYSLLRTGGGGGGQNSGGQNSDIYRVGTGLDYVLTPRLTVTGAYDFGYLDIEREPTAFTHTPRLGGTYVLTPTLTATATAGPSFLVTDRDTSITPAANARVIKQMSWGAMSVFYDRAIGVTGGFGGPSDNQSFGGNVSVRTLMRGLAVDFSPRYSISKTESAARSSADIDAFTANLSVRYQISRDIAVVGAYTFFRQRGSGNATSVGGNAATTGIDQNRITLGLQFGYPINFD